MSGAAGRNLLSAAIAAAGVAVAVLVGASLTSALIALLAGAATVLLVRGQSERPQDVVDPPAAARLPPLPTAVEMAEAMDQPVLIVRNRKILLTNDAARAVLGGHIEGADVRLAIRHPAAAERLSSDASDAAKGTTRIELVGLGDLDRRWEMATSALADGSWLVRLTDRSELHATEQMRVDFVANASHELRTPLATLLGFIETLQDERAADDRKTRARFLTIMWDEARRMQQLVEDLISLSRIEAERFSAPRDSVDMLSLVEEVRVGCHQLCEDHGSKILVRNGGEKRLVLGDRSQLLQLLRNLVVNALKYGRSGTDVVVEFGHADQHMMRMTVIDQGEGIPPEHLPRLTERFYRVDTSRSRALGGTGLGLAIVKHIVGRHRGRLDIRSRVGEGTAVHVFLPKPADPTGSLSSKSHTNVTEVAPNGHRDAPQVQAETGRRQD